MRRILAATAVVLCAGCGSATAEERFVAEVRESGIWPSDSAVTLLENEPCPWLEHAYKRDGVLGLVEQIGVQDDDGAYLGEFLIYAGAAVEHLCPDLREPWRVAVDLYEDDDL